MTTPSEIYCALIRAAHQFVLVGDCNHASPVIRGAFAKLADHLLRSGSFSHIGLELDFNNTQSRYTNFLNAPLWQRYLRIDAVRFNLCRRKPEYVHHPDAIKRMHEADSALALAARKTEAKIHCLNDLEKYAVPYFKILFSHLLDEQEAKLRKSSQDKANLRSLFLTLAQLPQLIKKGKDFAMRSPLIDDHNRGLDIDRAHMFMNACGHGRGILFYGAGHYRGAGGLGIDHWLPPNQTIRVCLTDYASLSVDADLTGPWRDRGGNDFTIFADGLALVHQRAVTRGLWPAPI